ncbi:MAG TPA: response regulator transcription factor [Dongiaceae bacterium]
MTPSNASSLTKILIADDHVMIIDALCAYLKRQAPQAEILTAGDIDRATTILAAHPDCDIAIFDYVMPGVTGADTFKDIIQRFPNLKVVILSGHIEHDLVQVLVAAGVHGVLPKTMPSSTLISAINLILSGETYVPWQLQQASAATDLSTSTGVTLSRREQEVLGCVKQGMTNKEIARELDLQEVTIKLHIGSLCRKFEVSNRTQLAIKALHRKSA